MRNLTKSVTAFHYLCFHACIIIDIHLMNGTFPVEINYFFEKFLKP